MRLFINFPRIGHLIKMFVLSDLFLVAGWGLINPLFAIFVVEKIENATVVTVGITAAIYWLSRAIFQMPVAILLDKIKGDKDDFFVVAFGLTVVALSAFSFIFINQIWQLYLLQTIQSVGFSLYTPAWYSIFSKHLDKDHEAVDWSLDSVSVSIAAGVTGLISGVLVKFFNFQTIFFFVGLFSLIAALIVFWTPKIIFPGNIHRNRKYPTINKKPSVGGASR